MLIRESGCAKIFAMKKKLRRKIHFYTLLYLSIKTLGGALIGTSIYLGTSSLLPFEIRLLLSASALIIFIILSIPGAIKKISTISGAGEELVNAYELMKKDEPENPYTVELLNILYEEVLSKIIPVSQYMKKLTRYLLIPIIIALCAILIPSIISYEREKRRIVEYQGLVEDAIITVNPPSYTNFPGENIYHMSHGKITVPEGSDISLKMKLNVEGKTEIDVCGDKETTRRTDGYYEFQIKKLRENCDVKVEVNVRKTIFKETPFTFIVKRDEEPYVQILHPGKNMILEEPPQNFKIRFFAQDDYRITRAELVYEIEGRWLERIEKEVNENTSSIEDSFTMDLSRIPRGLRISYRIEVEDNDEINGHKRGFSETYYIYIPERFSFHEELMKEIYALFEKTVKLLALTISTRYSEATLLIETMKPALNSTLKEVMKDESASIKLLEFLRSMPQKIESLKESIKDGKSEEALEGAENITYEFFLALKAQTLADAYTVANEIKRLLEELKTARAKGDNETEKLISMEISKKFEKLRELVEKMPKDILQENFNPDALKYREGSSPSSYEEILESLLKMIERGGMRTSMMGNEGIYEKMQELKEKVQSIIDMETSLKEKTDSASSQCSNNWARLSEGRKLADEQMGIREKTKGLSEEWGERYPQIMEAEEHMERAEKTLKYGNLESASEHEGKAIESLKNTMESIEDEMRKMREGWRSISAFRGREGVNGVVSNERVDIPEEVERKEAEEIRKEVMRIIREGLPEKYREENRRYYEDLVR